LLHLVDATSADVGADYKTVRRELKAYGNDIDKKKEIVALSKIDALDDATLAERREILKKAARKTPLLLSAVSGAGMKDALFALVREISRNSSADADAEGNESGHWEP
jgi:GTP-binding protein